MVDYTSKLKAAATLPKRLLRSGARATRWATTLGAAALLAASPAQAIQASVKEINMCVYDPIGASGPLYQALEDYRAAALSWGAKLNLKSYTDEGVAANEFKAGVCDLVNLSGVRARNFNSFTGTIDSIGAIPTYKHLKIVLDTLAGSKASKLMRDGDYEIVSIVPGGAIFPFVSDRSIDSPEKLAGKKIGILDSAPEMQYLVKQVGMTPVNVTISNVFNKFNNRAIEVTGAPAIVFEPMELYKGLEPNGGIVRWPLVQVTLQVVGRWQNLPDGFGEQSRNYARERYVQAIEEIETSEENIPTKYWVDVPNDLVVEWTETFRENRIALRDQGIYNGKALSLFRKVRCSVDPQLSECSADNKE